MGVSPPHGAFKLHYQPTITIEATLIGNPPFEIVRDSRNKVQVIDPTNHPVLYKGDARNGKMESDAAENFVKVNGFTGLYEYAGDPELFKAAYREAIDLAVKRIADSWPSSTTSK